MAVDPLQDTTFVFMGETFAVRPTFRLIAKIEATLGQSARMLAIAINEGTMLVSAYAAVMVCICAEVGALKNKTGDQIGDAVMDEGFANIRLPMMLLLARANRGNKEHEKEALARNPPEEVEAGKQGQD